MPPRGLSCETLADVAKIPKNKRKRQIGERKKKLSKNLKIFLDFFCENAFSSLSVLYYTNSSSHFLPKIRSNLGSNVIKLSASVIDECV